MKNTDKTFVVFFLSTTQEVINTQNLVTLVIYCESCVGTEKLVVDPRFLVSYLLSNACNWDYFWKHV